MKINEISKNISYTDKKELFKKLDNLVITNEPALNTQSVHHDIDKRNKLGEGLMTPEILSVHVQDKLVQKDIVFYISLAKSFKYYSQALHKYLNIKKIVLIVVNPDHQLEPLKQLEEFIGESKEG